jgi:hypothetical protein
MKKMAGVLQVLHNPNSSCKRNKETIAQFNLGDIMKTFFILVSVMVILFIASPNNVEAQQKSSAGQKQTLPKFRNGISYREVRKKLMKLGWQPVTLPTATSCGDDDRCRGLPEVYGCGVGASAMCIYMWKKKTTLIRVFGSGESSDQNYYGYKPCKSLHPTKIDGFTCQ